MMRTPGTSLNQRRHRNPEGMTGRSWGNGSGRSLRRNVHGELRGSAMWCAKLQQLTYAGRYEVGDLGASLWLR
jgi:hypothetical protein